MESRQKASATEAGVPESKKDINSHLCIVEAMHNTNLFIKKYYQGLPTAGWTAIDTIKFSPVKDGGYAELEKFLDFVGDKITSPNVTFVMDFNLCMTGIDVTVIGSLYPILHALINKKFPDSEPNIKVFFQGGGGETYNPENEQHAQYPVQTIIKTKHLPGKVFSMELDTTINAPTSLAAKNVANKYKHLGCYFSSEVCAPAKMKAAFDSGVLSPRAAVATPSASAVVATQKPKARIQVKKTVVKEEIKPEAEQVAPAAAAAGLETKSEAPTAALPNPPLAILDIGTPLSEARSPLASARSDSSMSDASTPLHSADLSGSEAGTPNEEKRQQQFNIDSPLFDAASPASRSSASESDTDSPLHVNTQQRKRWDASPRVMTQTEYLRSFPSLGTAAKRPTNLTIVTEGEASSESTPRTPFVLGQPPQQGLFNKAATVKEEDGVEKKKDELLSPRMKRTG